MFVREHLAAKGWTHVGGNDYCPKPMCCWSDTNNATTKMYERHETILEFHGEF
tara:strand:+ start:333 stop:491 length:159 start_codon:yes stop_codon:yes gene_type:complete